MTSWNEISWKLSPLNWRASCAPGARPSDNANHYHRSEFSVLITSQLKIKLIPEQKCGDSKAGYLQRVPYSKHELLEESIVYIASVFKVLQSCDADRFTGKFCVTDHSSSTMSSCHEAFAVVRTSSLRSKQHLKVRAAQFGLHNCITFKEQKFNKLQ